jgi:predicted site-specific integrase-resolvase
MIKKLITVPEAARLYLHVSPQTLYRQCRAGRVPGAVRVSENVWRISEHLLCEWLGIDPVEQDVVA